MGDHKGRPYDYQKGCDLMAKDNIKLKTKKRMLIILSVILMLVVLIGSVSAADVDDTAISIQDISDEYLTSDEGIKETLIANEYYFNKQGRIETLEDVA